MTNAETLIQTSSRLQLEASALVKELGLVRLLSKVGQVEQVGSSVTGLILNEEIDFKVYTDKPDSKVAPR